MKRLKYYKQPFKGNTAYRIDYINHNLDKPERIVPKDKVFKGPTLPDHYLSIMKQDYTPKEKGICPVYKYYNVHDILQRSSLYYPGSQNYYNQ